MHFNADNWENHHDTKNGDFFFLQIPGFFAFYNRNILCPRQISKFFRDIASSKVSNGGVNNNIEMA